MHKHFTHTPTNKQITERLHIHTLSAFLSRVSAISFHHFPNPFHSLPFLCDPPQFFTSKRVTLALSLTAIRAARVFALSKYPIYLNNNFLYAFDVAFDIIDKGVPTCFVPPSSGFTRPNAKHSKSVLSCRSYSLVLSAGFP